MAFKKSRHNKTTKSKVYPGKAGKKQSNPSGNNLTEANKPAHHMKRVPTNSVFLTGDFSVYNPKKYVGTLPIVYRSSYEFEFMRKLEMNPTVKAWNSENIRIPYKMKVGSDIKTRNYYMDFEVISKTDKKYIIEVKPIAKTPTTKTAIHMNPENYMNACKWKAAILWTKRNNYTFRIIGENHLKKHINFE